MSELRPDRSRSAPIAERWKAHWLDLVGLTLVGLLIGWASICANQTSGASARNLNLLLLAATGAYVLARLATPYVPWVVAVTAIVLVAVVMLSHQALHNDPLAGPLGYGNSDAALGLLGTVAAAMTATGTKRWWIRAPAVLIAVAGAVAAGLDGSKAACAGAGVVVVATAVMLKWPLRRAAIVAGAIATALILAITVVLGLAYATKPAHPNAADRLVERTLTYNRPLLWHDAEQLTAHHPGFGVGPERFQRTSPTALSDPLDLRWAQNVLLQQTAELGIVGGAISTALVGWCFLALGRSRRNPALVAVAAIGLAAVLGQALQDYILHYAVVTITAAGLLGAATSRSRRLRPPEASDPHTAA